MTLISVHSYRSVTIGPALVAVRPVCRSCLASGGRRPPHRSLRVVRLRGLLHHCLPACNSNQGEGKMIERSLQAASSSSTTSTRVTARRPGTTCSTKVSPFAGRFRLHWPSQIFYSGHDARLAASHSCCHSATEIKYFGEDSYWSTHGPVFSMKRHP